MKWRRRQTPFPVAMTKGRKLARLVLIGRPSSETARKFGMCVRPRRCRPSAVRGGVRVEPPIREDLR